MSILNNSNFPKTKEERDKYAIDYVAELLARRRYFPGTPPRLERVWTTKAGFLAMRVIMWGNAFRTGYVGVPEGHPLYGLEYQDIPEGVEPRVHGGITFSDGGSHGRKGTPFYRKAVKTWWFGFDCAHMGDDSGMVTKFPGDVKRSRSYVAEECERLALQLREIVEGKTH